MYNLENPQKWKNFIPSSYNLNLWTFKHFIYCNSDKLTLNDVGDRNWISAMVDLGDCHQHLKLMKQAILMKYFFVFFSGFSSVTLESWTNLYAWFKNCWTVVLYLVPRTLSSTIKSWKFNWLDTLPSSIRKVTWNKLSGSAKYSSDFFQFRETNQ